MGGYNFKTFDTSKEQLENLIFARMDSYVRKPSSAPGAEGNKLKLSGTDKDNVLMRLAAAAARRTFWTSSATGAWSRTQTLCAMPPSLKEEPGHLVRQR